MTDPTFDQIINEDAAQTRARADWDPRALESHMKLGAVIIWIGILLALLQYVGIFPSLTLGLVFVFSGMLVLREAKIKTEVLMLFEKKSEIPDEDVIDRELIWPTEEQIAKY